MEYTLLQRFKSCKCSSFSGGKWEEKMDDYAPKMKTEQEESSKREKVTLVSPSQHAIIIVSAEKKRNGSRYY